MTDLHKLTERQHALIPPEEIEKYLPVVVGLGNVGHQVALMLTKMGARNITLIDFDSVSVENVYPQGYMLSDVGFNKSEICANEMERLLTGEDGLPYRVVSDPVWVSKFSTALLPEDQEHTVVFACVDDMDARREIFEACFEHRSHVPLMIDGRCGGETFQVFSVTQATKEDYKKTLFGKGEGTPAPCGARATIYTGTTCAAMMCHQFAHLLRGLPLTKAFEFTFTDQFACVPEF